MENIEEFLRNSLTRLLDFSLINRRIVLVIDLAICLVGFFFAIALRYAMLPESVLDHLPMEALVFIGINLLFFVIFHTYRGLIRHATYDEMWRILAPLIFSSGGLYLYVRFFVGDFPLLGVLILGIFLICFSLVLFSRMLIVRLYNFTNSYSDRTRKKMLVYGIGAHSIALEQWINKSRSSRYIVVGFISQDEKTQNTRLHSLPVYSLNLGDLDAFLRKNGITVVAFPSYKTAHTEHELTSKLIEKGVSVFISQPLEKLNSADNIQFQMRPIQFEDLLERDEIKISMDTIGAQLEQKVVLISGAAGSIRSELTRQLAAFNPKKLILLDMAETPLHNLRLEMENSYPQQHIAPVIGDIRNRSRLEFIFEKYHPEIIYHAAAYKHVPLMEENPCEAILDNVLGTKQLSDFAWRYNVERFVMISTDKAVNSTNIMGASKRIAEIYVQSLAKRCNEEGGRTQFVTTRFGNVLGSNGSVIPLFKSQIEKGGPVTVTHPDIIRYFMTIPEACRLVLEAAALGRSGEIYVFDMGKPVKIVDLAKQMIEMAGLVPNVDIKIEFTGLRPGEKLYEELLSDKEKTVPTSHDKIMIASVMQYDLDFVNECVDTMIKEATKVHIPEVIVAMKTLVPEFVSQNSPYAIYDKKRKAEA